MSFTLSKVVSGLLFVLIVGTVIYCRAESTNYSFNSSSEYSHEDSKYVGIDSPANTKPDNK